MSMSVISAPAMPVSEARLVTKALPTTEINKDIPEISVRDEQITPDGTTLVWNDMDLNATVHTCSMYTIQLKIYVKSKKALLKPLQNPSHDNSSV